MEELCMSLTKILFISGYKNNRSVALKYVILGKPLATIDQELKLQWIEVVNCRFMATGLLVRR
jgi:hypothetical protein